MGVGDCAPVNYLYITPSHQRVLSSVCFLLCTDLESEVQFISTRIDQILLTRIDQILQTRIGTESSALKVYKKPTF